MERRKTELYWTGQGEDTFTSGFELPFTSRPTVWDNEYFRNLVQYQWRVRLECV